MSRTQEPPILLKWLAMLRINEGSERQDGELLQTSIGQRSGPLVSTIFCGSKLTRSGWPSILQLNSTLFSSGAIVGSPEGVFFGRSEERRVGKECRCEW